MLKRFIIEIHRRSLWQVLAIYAVASWGALQVADALTNTAGLPDWVPGFALVLLIIGLPIVMATAFVQEGMPGAREQEDTGGDAPVSEPPASATNLARGTGSLDLPSTRPPAHHRLFTWRNAVLGGVGAFTLLGLATAGYMAMRVMGLGSPGTLLAQGVLEEGASVVLADFTSGADPELGAVVTKTLRIDLLQSPTIRVLERGDLGDALGRMHIPADVAISGQVATQLAEREGYAAVITGDVSAAGSGYVLTASILAGQGLRPVAGFRETARDDAELVDAIERLSRGIRDKAGESLRSVRGGPRLAQVTTSSLPALRAYTRGEELQTGGDELAALEHYEHAIALDSTFAMAYRKLSTALVNLGIRPADERRAVRRAYELRDRLPALERHLAAGSFHQRVSGDIDAARSSYERALLVDSLNPSVRNSLANLYRLLGRYEEAEALFAGALRERPVAALWQNLATVRFEGGDRAAAEATLDSARAALPNFAGSYWVEAGISAASGDYAAADSVVLLLEGSGGASARERARFARHLLATVRGRLREAERALTAPGAELFLADAARVEAELATIELQRGDTAGAVRRVQSAVAEHGLPGSSDILFGMIDVLTEARAVGPASELLAAWEQAVGAGELGLVGRIQREMASAQVAWLKGDLESALTTFEELRRELPGTGSGTSVDYLIGRVHDELGNADQAISEYERSFQRHDSERFFRVLQVPYALRRLAELHDERGDAETAAGYYTRFAELWADADAELQPQVRRARARAEMLVQGRG